MSAPPSYEQIPSKEQESEVPAQVPVAPQQQPVLRYQQLPMVPQQQAPMAVASAPAPVTAAGGQIYVQPTTVQMMGFQQFSPPLAPEYQPNDFLIISLMVIIVCGIFNLSSLFFTVPAIVCSALAYDKKKGQQYLNAKKLGMAAIILDVVAVMWVCMWAIIFTGVTIGCIIVDYNNCNYY